MCFPLEFFALTSLFVAVLFEEDDSKVEINRASLIFFEDAAESKIIISLYKCLFFPSSHYWI